MNIFITGGSGFVGGHLITSLGEAHRITAMARSEGSARAVEALGAESVRTSLESVTAADLEGVDVVIHAAAYVEEWGSEEQFAAINVAGTERLLVAAREAGVRRFVQISTNAVVFQSADQHDVDETYTPPDRLPFPYATTKAAAERIVLDAHAEGFFTIALRPCFVWGPGDTTLLPVLQEMVETGRFAWMDQGRALVSTTHVANLVSAVRAALTGGEGGQAYFIADDDTLTLREFMTGLASTRGFTLPARSLPGGLVRPLASAIEGTWSALGLKRTPPLTRMAAALMSTAMTVRTDKAAAELGWRPVIQRAEALAALSA